MKFRGYPGAGQPAGIFHVLFKKKVERSDSDECRWQPTEIRRPRRDRGSGYIRTARLGSQQRAPAEAIGGGRPDELAAIRMQIGCAPGAIVDHRRVKHLETDRNFVLIARIEGECGGVS